MSHRGTYAGITHVLLVSVSGFLLCVSDRCVLPAWPRSEVILLSAECVFIPSGNLSQLIVALDFHSEHIFEVTTHHKQCFMQKPLGLGILSKMPNQNVLRLVEHVEWYFSLLDLLP